mmetsp:Transcript_32239/g.70337  ORF Transcript_32239/g.70337 Transcript_32239/m.70337 type:complete len:202 (-) Transcript_32239:279-884(-)|eukprot:CAMPEP_0118942388 /NCGR_PEP_ID=MMETSP1169-20130426/36059_1 /TAXON_ID=36882 /ORGANISM="Pyramimonas obovata, Strain CCMP722" /LENGTH=201 /DNA_ID=CAMNT_0006887395 /DNA_START=348 /DNA_END=953 /DNA_ORIENTATION=+
MADRAPKNEKLGDNERGKASKAGEADPNEDKFWLSDGESDGSGMGSDELEHPDFYDSEADDEDEEWAMKQRAGRETDAILSCPCCLETLTLESQRHAVHSHQYRTMFVQPGSVRVDRTQHVRMPPPPPPQKMNKQRTARNKKNAPASEAATSGTEPMAMEQPSAEAAEAYHPVQCAACETEVGLFDSKDVYHFFHVFPSAG